MTDEQRRSIRLHAALDQDIAYTRDMNAAIAAARIQHGCERLPVEIEEQVVAEVRRQLERGGQQ